jgi:NADPH:quinone reductase-like Zn-dependent oxidoreductase
MILLHLIPWGHKILYLLYFWDWLFVHYFPRKESSRIDHNDDIRGKTVVVTGGNAGIGRQTALRLAQNGAKNIILACRSPKRAEEAKEYILDRVPHANVVRIENNKLYCNIGITLTLM